MKQLFLFLFTACSLTADAQINRCKIISIDHFGGNKGDLIGPQQVFIHADGSFSIGVATTSTSGSINQGCVTPAVGRYFFRTYAAGYGALLGETCFPSGNGFNWPTPYFYPQANGDTILIGTSTPNGPTYYDIIIERRNGNNTIWSKRYGGSFGEAADVVVPTQDSGFFIVTATTSNDGDVGLHYGDQFSGDAWVLRVDKNGDKLWSKVLGGSQVDIFRTVIPSDDGGCYLFGVTASSDHDATGMKGVSDLWIVKLDSLGNKQWHKCLGGSGDDGAGYDGGVFAIKDGQGGFYVLNRSASQDGDVQQRRPSADGQADLWLLHIDSLANIIWETTYGGKGLQAPTGLCRATDGSLWMISLTEPTFTDTYTPDLYGGQDGWVVHADSMGNYINQRTLGSDGDDYLDIIHPLPDGTVLIGGNYPGTFTPGSGNPGFPQSNEGDQDIFLAHLGPETVSIDDIGANAFCWQVYPNPAGRELKVEIGDPDAYKGLRLGITDAQGRQVYTMAVKDKITRINCKAFAAGAYVVRLSDAKGSLGVKKVAIRH